MDRTDTATPTTTSTPAAHLCGIPVDKLDPHRSSHRGRKGRGKFHRSDSVPGAAACIIPVDKLDPGAPVVGISTAGPPPSVPTDRAFLVFYVDAGYLVVLPDDGPRVVVRLSPEILKGTGFEVDNTVAALPGEGGGPKSSYILKTKDRSTIIHVVAGTADDPPVAISAWLNGYLNGADLVLVGLVPSGCGGNLHLQHALPFEDRSAS